MTAWLITSAGYVDAELEAEYGRLPSAFLPLGHCRLYERQAEHAGPERYLTLPASYAIPAADEERLDELGFTVLPIADGLSLCASVHAAIAAIGGSGPLRILHGDTLIGDIPEGDDLLAVGAPPEGYAWGAVPDSQPDAADAVVLAGYFAFSDRCAFREALGEAHGDFVAAIAGYDRVVPLAQHHVAAWLDCGHLQTFYRSRCTMRVERAFNAMDISFQTVTKRGEDRAKLAAEARWFEDIPPKLRLYTPAFLGASDGGYALEYLPLPSLHDLFVFGAVPAPAWDHILEACMAFLEQALTGRPVGSAPCLRALTLDKTLDRLERYARAGGPELDRPWRYAGRPLPALETIARRTAEWIDYGREDFLGVMHGDFCFTNLFYDFRTRRIKVIDPRGTIDGVRPSIAGDLRYDLGKLHHSLLGWYDYILAGRFRCEGFGDRDVSLRFPADRALEQAPALARELRLSGLGLDEREVAAIGIHLFLAMLPLHADSPMRQQAFLANALRLFAEHDAR